MDQLTFSVRLTPYDLTEGAPHAGLDAELVVLDAVSALFAPIASALPTPLGPRVVAQPTLTQVGRGSLIWTFLIVLNDLSQDFAVWGGRMAVSTFSDPAMTALVNFASLATVGGGLAASLRRDPRKFRAVQKLAAFLGATNRVMEVRTPLGDSIIDAPALEQALDQAQQPWRHASVQDLVAEVVYAVRDGAGATFRCVIANATTWLAIRDPHFIIRRPERLAGGALALRSAALQSLSVEERQKLGSLWLSSEVAGYWTAAGSYTAVPRRRPIERPVEHLIAPSDEELTIKRKLLSTAFEIGTKRDPETDGTEGEGSI